LSKISAAHRQLFAQAVDERCAANLDFIEAKLDKRTKAKLDSHSLRKSVMQDPIKGTSFTDGNESTVIKWKI